MNHFKKIRTYQHTDPTCILFCHLMFFSDDIHSPRCCIFINFWAHRIENVIDWKSIHSYKVISRKYVKNPKENFETDFRLQWDYQVRIVLTTNPMYKVNKTTFVLIYQHHSSCAFIIFFNLLGMFSFLMTLILLVSNLFRSSLFLGILKINFYTM